MTRVRLTFRSKEMTTSGVVLHMEQTRGDSIDGRVRSLAVRSILVRKRYEYLLVKVELEVTLPLWCCHDED